MRVCVWVCVFGTNRSFDPSPPRYSVFAHDTCVFAHARTRVHARAYTHARACVCVGVYGRSVGKMWFSAFPTGSGMCGVAGHTQIHKSWETGVGESCIDRAEVKFFYTSSAPFDAWKILFTAGPNVCTRVRACVRACVSERLCMRVRVRVCVYFVCMRTQDFTVCARV